MKSFSLLIGLILLPIFAFGSDVQPQPFGVQYMMHSITGEPNITFNLTIDAKDLPSMEFGSLFAKDILVDGEEIVPSMLVYGKSPGTVISPKMTVIFSFIGVDALYAIKYLEKSKLVLYGDDGSEFSINLGQLCKTAPQNFTNLFGGQGCKVDQKEIDDLISKAEQSGDESNNEPGRCEDHEELLNLKKTFCGSGPIIERIEKEYNCKFTCE